MFLYSIADLSLREIAGVCAGSGKRISDEAVRQRLAACPKWVEGLLGKLLPVSTLPQRAEGSWQLVLCDGSQISGSGAKGTDYHKAILDMPDPTTRFGVRDRTMLHLSITAGLRVCELVGLRLDDVTFERHRCQARPESDHP